MRGTRTTGSLRFCRQIRKEKAPAIAEIRCSDAFPVDSQILKAQLRTVMRLRFVCDLFVAGKYTALADNDLAKQGSRTSPIKDSRHSGQPLPYETVSMGTKKLAAEWFNGDRHQGP